MRLSCPNCGPKSLFDHGYNAAAEVVCICRNCAHEKKVVPSARSLAKQARTQELIEKLGL